MSKFDWKSVVGKVAPGLATALGGPLAGVAVSALANEFLGEESTGPETEKQLETIIMGGSPEVLERIKKIDNDFTLRMRELGVEEFKVEAADRASARELAKTDMTPQIVLSAIFIGGYFWVVYALVIGKFVIPEGQGTLVATLIGVLTAGVANIMQFWFGSSSGSKNKDSKKS